jgi:hypothetical protein
MKTLLMVIGLMFVSLSANAAPRLVKSFNNGSTVACTASHNIGNDGKGYTEQKMDVFYRIEDRQTEASAYFKQVVKLGNYSFDGSCGPEVCDLSIRDLRTNTVSNMNAAYAVLNNLQSQITIMNFGENLTLTLLCKLTK